MSHEAVFLSAIRAHPADDTLRLVYADWLEERNGPEDLQRATYLRQLAYRTPTLNDQRGMRFTRQDDGEPGLDVNAVGRDWLPLVDKVAVENCPAAVERTAPLTVEDIQWNFICFRRWEEMAPTSSDTVRHCDMCNKEVHYCQSVAVARVRARQGHCVAVELGNGRQDGDLYPSHSGRTVGLPDLLPIEDRSDSPTVKDNDGEESHSTATNVKSSGGS